MNKKQFIKNPIATGILLSSVYMARLQAIISGPRIDKHFVTRKLLLQRTLFGIMLKLHAIKNFRLNEANTIKIVSHLSADYRMAPSC